MKESKGKLIVGTGSDSVVVETSFMPNEVMAEFIDCPQRPTCNPGEDTVQADFFHDGHKFGVLLSWKVSSPTREIFWKAIKRHHCP